MQQTSAKKSTRLGTMGGEGDRLGIMKEIYIWLYNQMVYAQTRICLGEWDSQNSLVFWDMNESSNPGQKSRPKKKK